MGVICQGCQDCNRINLLNLEDGENENSRHPEKYFPKYNIHNIPDKDNDEKIEEKILIKFDSNDKEEEKDKASLNTNSESQYTIKKQYSKSKSASSNNIGPFCISSRRFSKRRRTS